MNQKISVIIPVYNAEKYLLPTLNSIRFQTYRNLEIICVLDCPTDDSEEIIREIAKKDDRIKIVSNPQNSGPAESRNNGVRHATGEYIHFMDADDLLTHDFYELLLDTAYRTGADVCACSIFSERQPKRSLWFTNEEIITGKDKVRKTEVLTKGWMWRYVIKKSFWEEHNFHFPDLMVKEDLIVAVSVIHHANKVALCPEAVYFYKNRESSILNRNRSEGTAAQKTAWKESLRNAKKAKEQVMKRYQIQRSDIGFVQLKKRITSKLTCIGDPFQYGQINKKISVIIPIYNVEKYVSRAVNSVRFQTYNNLEIVCVLDCPTDSSVEIVTQIAAEDKRVKLVKHLENKGLPAARNSGLQNATGEYIHFMDSDDWVSPDFYETLVHAAEKAQADIAACSVYYEKKPWRSVWFRKSEVLYDNSEKIKKTEVTVQSWAWRYLIKKSFWDDYQFSFPDLVPVEDKPVVIPMIYYANKVVLCPYAVYFYKYRQHSILNKKKSLARQNRDSENRGAVRRLVADFSQKNKIKQPNRWWYYLKKYFTIK